MAEIPLGWRIFSTGAEQVKRDFDDLKTKLIQNKITSREFKEEVRELRKEHISFSEQMRINKQIYELTHPSIAALTRAMGALNHVMRTVITVQNALNIAQLATQGANASAIDAQLDYNEAVRNRVRIEGDANATDEEKADAKARENAALAKLNETLAQNQNQQLSNILTITAAIALVSSEAITAAANLPLFIAQLKALGDYAPVLVGKLGPLALALAVIAGFIVGQEIKDEQNPWWVTTQQEWEEFVDAIEQGKIHIGTAFGDFQIDLDQMLTDFGFWATEMAIKAAFFFGTELPQAAAQWLTYMSVDFWRDVNAVWDSIWLGVQAIAEVAMNNIRQAIFGWLDEIVNSVRNAWDALMRDIAKNASPKPNRPGQSRSVVDLTPRKSTRSAVGMNEVVSTPTNILTGEGEPELVQITPLSQLPNLLEQNITLAGGKGGGQQTIIYFSPQISIGGGLYSKSELFEDIDDELFKMLYRMGFRPGQ